jgi:hypothetical protein
MCRAWTVLLLCAIPALADSGLFPYILNKDTVTLVLPVGECNAKVVSRNLNGLTLRLKKKTAACGERGSLVTVSRADVRDVVNNRPRVERIPPDSPAAVCAIGAMSFLGAPAALAIGEGAGSDVGALAALVGTGVAGALLCHDRSARYTVFTGRIAPALP